jgi:hypothetical protein
MMRKDDILTRYNDMPGVERRAIDQWVASVFAIATVLACGLLWMAFAASDISVSPERASAAGRDTVGMAAPKADPKAPKAAPSAFELMSTASDRLPVQPADVQPF